MDEDELNEIRKIVANKAHLLSKSVDVEFLIDEGIVKQVGKSFYVESLDLLPEDTRKLLKSVKKGRYGIRVEFAKGSKSMANLAEKFKQFRD